MNGDDGPRISSFDTYCRDEEVAARNQNEYLSRKEFEHILQDAATLPVEETEQGVQYQSEVAVLEDNRQLGVDPHSIPTLPV